MTLKHNIQRHMAAAGKIPYLCFTALTAGATIALNKTGSPDAISLKTSPDGVNWSPYTWDGSTGSPITLSTIGDKVYWKVDGKTNTLSKSTSDYYRFRIQQGSVEASGSIMSLLDEKCKETSVPDYAFYNLFANCTYLNKAPILPAMIIGAYGYRGMFYGCTALTEAPALPATTLGNSSYLQMFYGCTALTEAPALPATTLAQACYRAMFYNNTSLSVAPTLAATTLAISCYQEMFKGCTALTEAPALPATTLVTLCYSSMFQGCAALERIDCDFTSWLTGATTNWVDGVAGSGDFYCPQALDTTVTRGADTIPSGWTIHQK